LKIKTKPLNKRLEVEIENTETSRNEILSAFDPSSIMTDPLSPHLQQSMKKLYTNTENSPSGSPQGFEKDTFYLKTSALKNAKKLSLLI
jgi:hypothetical protein